MKKTGLNSRDELLHELLCRFKDGNFKKSEKLNKRKKDSIWIGEEARTEDGLPIVYPNMKMHPDFEILLDKYDAWLEPASSSDGFWVIIRLKAEQKEDEVVFNRPFAFLK